jgi:hypothetical protein
MLNMNKELSSNLSLNGDIRFNAQDRYSKNKVEQMTLFQENSQLDSINTNNNYVSNSVAANFTLEWKPDTVNTLIFRPNISFNNSHSDEWEMLKRSNYDNGSRIYDSESNSKNKGGGYNLSGTLDYSHKFSKPGRVFSINARGTYNDSYSYERSRTDYTKYIEYGDIYDLNQHIENDNNTKSYRATVSWVEPLGHNNFLQALYRYSHSDTKSINSTYDLYDWTPDSNNLEDWAIRNDTLSRSTVRNSTEQRIGLSFKSVRAKYNYTIGFNVDPSNSINETWQPSGRNDSIQSSYQSNRRLPNTQGHSLVSEPIKQNVINFSPVVNFNYIFGQRTNLKVNYEGETNQPSAAQLRDYTDMSRPTNWVKGNPNLQMGYRNNLRVRFQKYVAATQLMYSVDANGTFSSNDITSITQRIDSVRNLTTYDNVNGNWNAQLRGMFSIPLKNKKFSIGSFARSSYNNQNSYVGVGREIDQLTKLKNTQKSLALSNNSRINYRSDLFDFGLNVSVDYNTISNSIRPEQDQNIFTYGLGANTSWYLPHNFTIESDINWTKRNGYIAGYNITETMWNAAVTKQLFNKKYGTGLLKMQVYDLLHNRSNISSSVTTNGFRTSQINVIPTYFMCSFIYKFKFFPKSSSATEDDLRGNRQWNGPGPGGPPPGGRDGRGPGSSFF